MKQRYKLSADGIEPVGFVIFVTIAALACQSQVFQVGLSFRRFGEVYGQLKTPGAQSFPATGNTRSARQLAGR